MSDYSLLYMVGSFLVQSFHYCSHCHTWLAINNYIIIVKLPLLLVVEIENLTFLSIFINSDGERNILFYILNKCYICMNACKSKFSNQDQSPHPNSDITFCRLTLAMASIVIISLQIRLTNQRCGQKLGLAGITNLKLVLLCLVTS